MPNDIDRRRGRDARRRLGVAGLAIVLGVGASSALAGGPTIRFEHLTAEDGLSQSSVLCMLQDSRGFMWLGTEAGLNRYDGRSVTVYRHDVHDTASLPSDFVWGLAEDTAGDLWVATEGGGLARWERARDRFTRYPIDPKGVSGSPSRQLRTVFVGRDGGVWVGTKDAGLSRLDIRNGSWQTFTHADSDDASLANNGVYALREDSAGSLWVGTNGGLSRLDPTTSRFRNYRHDPKNATSLSDDRVRGIREDRDGRLWIATFGGGLDVLAKGGEHFEHFRHDPANPLGLADDHVLAALEDGAGRLWVGTRSGLQLRQPDGSFATYRHDPAQPDSLGDDDVLSLLEDRSGVLWFGTRAGGAARFDPRTWAFGQVPAAPGDPRGLANGYVTSFSEDALGQLWIGTMGGGLHRMDRATGRMQRFSRGDAGLTDDRIMALLHDQRGQLWVGTMEGGLHRFDPRTQRFEVFRRPATLGASGIMTLLEDRRGSLWIGTYGGGLNRLDRDANAFVAYRHEANNHTSLSRDVVTALAEDKSGAIWVGTEGAGLNRLDSRDGRFQRFAHDPADPASLADDTIYSLHVDAEGTLWVGTRSGLSRLEKLDAGSGRATFRSYTASDGLSGNTVYGIESGNVGHLWLSGTQGLVRFDPGTGVFRTYAASHGLQGDEFNFGAHYRNPRGELFFGGPGGFNAFLPERLPSNSNPPPVVLTGFTKFNRSVPELGPAHALESLDLGYRDAVVSFEFAALDYSAPERNRYAYKLDGFDEDWIELGTERRVTLTSLDAGQYVLRVRAANSDGTWNHEGFALRLRMAPAPWRSPWAHAAYASMLAAAVASLVRRQRRKARLEAEYRRRLETEVQARTEELGLRNQELSKVNGQLLEMSLTDSLTGLRNRRYVFEQVSKDMSLVQRRRYGMQSGKHHEGSQLIFIMVDLDWFKPINDTCGHAAGDRVLIQVREVLQNACRNSDVLVRWGGDEFLVIGRANDLEGVEVVPERIRSLIEQAAFDLGDGQIAHLTASIGFTCYPAGLAETGKLSLEQVIALADRALYAAKKAGRNAWVGLLGTPTTDLAKLQCWIQDDTEGGLLDDDALQVRRSDTAAELLPLSTPAEDAEVAVLTA